MNLVCWKEKEANQLYSITETREDWSFNLTLVRITSRRGLTKQRVSRDGQRETWRRTGRSADRFEGRERTRRDEDEVDIRSDE